MRQNSRIEPPSQQPPVVALHPVLSYALAHLDAQLEAELARYRRQRTGAARALTQPGRTRSPEPLDLIAIAATTSGRSDASAASATDERLAAVAGKSLAPDAYKPIPAFTANPQPFDGAIALRPPQPLNDGSADAHTLAQAADPNLDDYLESSEALLRSLADEQAEMQAERNVMQSLLTPLGLGAMLLLLLSSAMVGYVIMNPSSLEPLKAKWNSPSAPGQPSELPQIPSLPPNSASRELPVLDPNHLGAIDPRTPTSAQPTVNPTSKPSIATPTGQARNASPTVPAESTAPPVAASSNRSDAPTTDAPRTTPTRSAPASSSTPVRRTPTTAPAPTASSQNSGGSGYQYKVGIPFENDQTLENARKVVPDAFVRTLPDGSTIVQGGAAHNEAEARAITQRLRDRGLSAEVYKR